MTALRALVLVLVGGCWYGAPAPAETTPASGVAAAPRPRRPRRVRIVEAPPPKSPYQLAHDLATELRTNPNAPLQYLAVTVVYDDLSQPTAQSLTGRHADQAAQSWGYMLADTLRSTPYCRNGPGNSFMCIQSGSVPDPLLVIQFCREANAWRLVGTFLGDHGNPATRKRFADFHTSMSSACP
jgi:hypothetical protein